MRSGIKNLCCIYVWRMEMLLQNDARVIERTSGLYAWVDVWWREIDCLSYTLEETLWSNACVIKREKYLGCVWEACGWTLSSIERVVKWLVREFVSCELSYVPWYGMATKNCLLFYAWRRRRCCKVMHAQMERSVWIIYEYVYLSSLINRPSR